MGHEEPRRFAETPELIEGRPDGAADLSPVPCRPSVRVRSPIEDDDPLELRPPAPDREPEATAAPTRGELVLLAWAILPAIAVLAVLGWQLAVVAGAVATAIRELESRTRGATFSFGDGFLPYRAPDGWPRGVQEEDEVHWDWPPTSRRKSDGRA